MMMSRSKSKNEMGDKDSFTSRSSLPLLLDKEEDDDDEIVFFEEEDDETHNLENIDYKDYEYFDGGHDDVTGYTKTELAQQVVFVRSSKDPKTGAFVRETKGLRWCIQNDCEEVEPGVWSGAWFFTYLLGEKEGKRAWVEAMNKRLVKECGGKAMKVDHDEFCAMLREKDKGNRSFSRGQYKSALDSYLRAENLLGGAVSGMYLVPHQRAELVKVLSNQAECYLRMKKFDDAILQASTALQLNKRHEKSLLRRAKALYEGADRLKTLNSGVAARAAEDLQVIIELESSGAKEARDLLNEIEMKMNSSSKSQ
jgi:tetratricopeptide (TPR) repeat protein